MKTDVLVEERCGCSDHVLDVGEGVEAPHPSHLPGPLLLLVAEKALDRARLPEAEERLHPHLQSPLLVVPVQQRLQLLEGVHARRLPPRHAHSPLPRHDASRAQVAVSRCSGGGCLGGAIWGFS